MKKFEVADGELVKPHIMIFLNPRQRRDVLYLAVLREVEILQNGPGGNNAEPQIIHAKSFQRCGIKMFQQFVTGIFFREYPVIQLVCAKPAPEQYPGIVAVCPFQTALPWVKNCAATYRHIQNCPRQSETHRLKYQEMQCRRLTLSRCTQARKLFSLCSSTFSFSAIPGVTSSVMPRFTIFFVSLGSSSCSQMATR